MNSIVQIIRAKDEQKVNHALERIFRNEHYVVDGRRRYLQGIRVVDDMKSAVIVVFGGRWMGGGTQ